VYFARVSDASDARLANLLGAASTGLVDAIEEATLAAARLDGSAPAALISLLDFSPSGSVEALSRVIGLTHSGTVRLVDRLVAAGYVTRGSGRDGRSLTVTLTPAGRTIAQSVRAARQHAIARTIEPLSKDQRVALSELCELLIVQLTERRLEQRAAGNPPASGALCRMCDFGACGRPDGTCPAAEAARR
jgi:MarR family transcriptional repressor of emrRAB